MSRWLAWPHQKWGEPDLYGSYVQIMPGPHIVCRISRTLTPTLFNLVSYIIHGIVVPVPTPHNFYRTYPTQTRQTLDLTKSHHPLLYSLPTSISYPHCIHEKVTDRAAIISSRLGYRHTPGTLSGATLESSINFPQPHVCSGEFAQMAMDIEGLHNDLSCCKEIRAEQRETF
jgi:hypothetical protein